MDIGDAGLNSIEQEIAIREVRVGCTMAMLTCLSRPLRIAYLVGDVLELTDVEAADALEISAAAHRQRSARARREVQQFVGTRCGIASAAALYRCERRVGAALESGRILRGESQLGIETATLSPNEIAGKITSLERGRAAAALMQSNPQFVSNLTRVLDTILDS